MTNFTSLQDLSALGRATEKIMPVLFIGHGSPMNGIENNQFSNYWKKLAKELPEPQAVLVISAHWLTRGTHVTAMPTPKTIHDFGGFPQALFDVQYPAPGQPQLATEISQLIESTNVGLDHDWGLDHGAWTVIRHMYPEADIPVLQLSIDYHKPAQYHYDLAKELAALRKKGVLIVGSGNVIHNLRMIDMRNINTDNFGFDWAKEFNRTFIDSVNNRDHQTLIDYQDLGLSAKYAIPTPDHYYPLMYTLGLQGQKEEVNIFNNKFIAGSLSMTSLQIGY